MTWPVIDEMALTVQELRDLLDGVAADAEVLVYHQELEDADAPSHLAPLRRDELALVNLHSPESDIVFLRLETRHMHYNATSDSYEMYDG